ncbi:ABC transporter substrate-binding protein [Paenibacillus sp. P96]|uniref:ABC transporter substrate-binding protein n=1 Tax=Paenibacillus zeirhizosphaerae TaxID=2987519 RepID=A0ABT9FQF0_9BACL|nr:ABC transporter substrate-binding protein [Paenibacillus sp. P96]MDP4096894.1 ABC transporter substrate-binding protein [Paenibacillus sp. P96]
MKKMLLTLLGLTLILMLAACGQPAQSQNTSNGNAADSSAAAETETETHAADAVIASLSIHITNNLLALGIQPAGSVVGGDVKDFLPHVADRLNGTAKLGVAADPDMESVLALKPDVIYVDQEFGGKDLASYEKIAPTISIDMDSGTWRDHLNRIAQIVGKEAEAKTFIEEYDKKANEVGQMIRSELGEDAKVMAIRMTAKELRVMGMKRPLGPILYEDLKLTPPEGVKQITDEPYQVISQEVLPDYDADAIFVIISKGEEAKSKFEELEKNPVWGTLKAVKNKHVYILDGQKWLDYSSLGHRMALDDAEKLFTK